jgi:hypothetical protein
MLPRSYVLNGQRFLLAIHGAIQKISIVASRSCLWNQFGNDPSSLSANVSLGIFPSGFSGFSSFPSLPHYKKTGYTPHYHKPYFGVLQGCVQTWCVVIGFPGVLIGAIVAYKSRTEKRFWTGAAIFFVAFIIWALGSPNVSCQNAYQDQARPRQVKTALTNGFEQGVHLPGIHLQDYTLAKDVNPHSLLLCACTQE